MMNSLMNSQELGQEDVGFVGEKEEKQRSPESSLPPSFRSLYRGLMDRCPVTKESGSAYHKY